MAAALRRGLALAVFVPLIALVAACAAQQASPTATATGTAALTAPKEPPGTLSETGSSLLFPLAQTWAQAYQQAHPAVKVTTGHPGSLAGIKAASDGTADIGASDAYLSSGDLVKNNNLLNIPLVVSAQTVVYNVPGISQGTHLVLDGRVLADIYRGKIKYWNDPRIVALNTTVNKGVTLPALKIVPVHRSDGSGDTFLFTSYLAVQDHDWNESVGYGTTALWPPVAGALLEAGSKGVMKACAATPGCVAYNGISYLRRALADHLGYAQLDNAFGKPALPTAQAINDAVASFVSITPPSETISMIDGPASDGYPIVNYEYAIVSKRQPSAAKASTLKDFLHWVVTTGNKPAYLDTVGFQPLPGDVVTLAEDQIKVIHG
jgi:phosphate transport system substrate-binding protein